MLWGRFCVKHWKSPQDTSLQGNIQIFPSAEFVRIIAVWERRAMKTIYGPVIVNEEWWRRYNHELYDLFRVLDNVTVAKSRNWVGLRACKPNGGVAALQEVTEGQILSATKVDETTICRQIYDNVTWRKLKATDRARPWPTFQGHRWKYVISNG